MSDNPEKSSKSRVKLLDLQPSVIQKSQLNNSISKMQYSIPKSPRWEHSKDNNDSSKFYNLPSIASKRAASFGYGNKIDISKLSSNSPPPNSYNLDSQFKPNKNKGISISLGRQMIKAVSTFNQKSFKVPGVGTYQVKQPETNKNFLIGARLKDNSDKWTLSVPGPGHYKTLELINQNLKSSLSTFQNPRTAKFGKSQRRSQEDERIRILNVPGPGKYQGKHQAIERFARQEGRRFSKSKRKGIIEDSITPGPGAYSYFSQFLH